MKSSLANKFGTSCGNELREMALTWAVAAAIPLPVLVAINPATSAAVACLYLGLASAWLVTEFQRCLGMPQAVRAWRSRALAITTATLGNVALFVAFGMAAGVETRFPLPLMALLSALPAVGIAPWLLRRVRHPYAAIILGAALVLAAKLAACVVARVVYGPDYIERGYVAADWRTAKLMISLFWSFSTLLSAGLLLADYMSCKRTSPSNRLAPDVPTAA